MKMNLTRRAFAAAGVAAILLAGTAIGRAELPAGQIRLVVDSGAGGGKDALARIVAEELGRELDRSVIVETVPGAGGLVGAQAVASSPANGLTLLLTGMNSTISPWLYPKNAFDPSAALTPVSTLMSLPFVLVVTQDYPAKDFDEFDKYLRDNPSKAKIATAGSTTTIAAALYLQQQGIEHTFIAYGGSGPTINALLTGEIDVFFGDLPSVSPYIANSQLRPIAVSSAERSPLLDDVPSATELGRPDYVVTSWYGVLAPKDTPADTVKQLHDAINEVIETPEMAEKMAALGGVPYVSGTEEFGKAYVAELARWKEIVATGDIKP